MKHYYCRSYDESQTEYILSDIDNNKLVGTIKCTLCSMVNYFILFTKILHLCQLEGVLLEDILEA